MRLVELRHLPLAVLVAYIVGLFAVASVVYAGKPIGDGNDRFAWAQWRLDKQNPVEQQSSGYRCLTEQTNPCVVNRTACAWDIDDSRQWAAVPNVFDPGSVTLADCLIADRTMHDVGVDIDAPVSDLEITLSYPDQGASFAITPEASVEGNWFTYRGCVTGPFYADLGLPEIQTIPGSGTAWSPDGRGLASSWQLTIANHGAKKVRWVSGNAQFNLSGPGTWIRNYACRERSDPFKLSGNAIWRTGL